MAMPRNEAFEKLDMLRIDKKEKKLVRLTKTTLADAEHWERQLQDMICADPDAFCDEIGERLRFVGQEVRPSDAVPDRIDILALDESGNAVVIELKRGNNKLQLLQAVSYAGMVSRWEADRLIETLAANFGLSHPDARSAIEEHTGLDVSSINNEQRILLIAEDFDPALLVATEWLHENFGVDIRCYRLQLSQENGSDYLTCTCIYPPLEIASLTRGSENRPVQSAAGWTDWDSALNGIENSALVKFVHAELARKQESSLPKRQVIYRVDGRRRFWLSSRKKNAYVWQKGRFEGDEAYWRKVLSSPVQLQEVVGGRSLSFHLASSADFVAFGNAMHNDLAKIRFVANDGGETPPDDE